MKAKKPLNDMKGAELSGDMFEGDEAMRPMEEMPTEATSATEMSFREQLGPEIEKDDIEN